LFRALIGWLRHYSCPCLKLRFGKGNRQRDRDDDTEAADKTAFHVSLPESVPISIFEPIAEVIFADVMPYFY